MSLPTSQRQSHNNHSHIVLIGPSGSGKSSIAGIVARRLDRQVIDIDAEIERAEGKPITEIFAERGEEAFRDVEASTILAAVKRKPGIIATGGGAILRQENRDCLWERGLVVYLRATPDTLTTRLTAQGAADRPLLTGGVRERISAMLEARSAYYGLADVIIDTDELDLETVAERIVETYARSS